MNEKLTWPGGQITVGDPSKIDVDRIAKAEWKTTPTYDRIMADLVPAWAEHFRRKNKDYSSQDFEPHKVLGEAGQFAEIWRKIWKLKKALWDGGELVAENEVEILNDLIGHCFLTLDMLRQKNGGERPCQDKRS